MVFAAWKASVFIDCPLRYKCSVAGRKFLVWFVTFIVRIRTVQNKIKHQNKQKVHVMCSEC